MLIYNKNLKQRAREMRGNLTETESILWKELKGRKLNDARFYRQKTIGNYIVDFYCAKYNLVIEVDGNQHYTEDAKEYDYLRDAFLEANGLKVIRFTNHQILNQLDKVLKSISQELTD